MEEISIKKSIKKDLLTIVGCLAFVGMGILVINIGAGTKGMIAGWASIIFFGLCATLMIAVDITSYNKPVLVIGKEKISCHTFRGYKDVKFSDVKFFAIIDHSIIGLYSTMPKSKLQPGIGGINLKGMDISSRELESIVTDRLNECGAQEIFF